MSLCPCGSEKTYETCCGLYIDQQQNPQTPEQLMRSRYTAYSKAKIDYIQKTMKDKALMGFDALAAQEWAQKATWLGLDVIQAEPTTSDIGHVEFAARFLEQGELKTIHEVSEFHKENGVWFYISGQHKKTQAKIKKPQTPRNAPCPCGSGKKFKNCHAK